jgi:hypothetical protein
LKLNFAQLPVIASFIQPNIQIDYHRIGQVADGAPIKRIYFLAKGEPAINRMGRKEAINKIANTSAGALDVFPPEGFPRRFVYSYYFANNLSPTFIEDRYQAILRDAISENVQIYVLYGWRPDHFKSLFEQNEIHLKTHEQTTNQFSSATA